MNKRFNTMRGGFRQALANLRRHRIFVYGTFIFGYEHDTPQSFDQAVDFATEEGMYIAAFNHLTPFPGTPLYKRLEDGAPAALPSMVARSRVPLQRAAVSCRRR